MTLADHLYDCIVTTVKAGPISIPGFGDLAITVRASGDPTRADDWTAKVYLESPESVDPDATQVPRAGATLTDWLVHEGAEKEAARRQVADFAASLKKNLLAGQVVDLAPVGVLAILQSAESLSRHPATQKWIRVAPTKRPTLELSDELKSRLARQ